MLGAKEIRESFKNFFASKGHQIVPSAPMVIKDDPSLMFTNAGMNQFKNIFLGQAPAKYLRVANSQKCLRVSGKHNDLEEVGHDTYHHTMFEMLGNWSFGDYFKKEAIAWAWEYLTEVLKLDASRLYATVFEGSPEEGLQRDDEAAGYWANYLPKEHIIDGNKHDNFWEMGETGPCGPCSEIHIDLRSEQERAQLDGLHLVNKNHPRVVEIWNLVFMQFNRKADGSLEVLPAKHIDTGMGFERLCMAVQGKTSNYDTDLFQPLIKEIGNLCDVPYGRDQQTDVAMRVVADHIRTIAFSITDGQLPSNTGAGYVIRRILRRAVRYAYTFLGRRRAFLYKLIPALTEVMGSAYPELKAQQNLVEKVIKEEEDAFIRTLESGIKMLEKSMEHLKASGSTKMDGKEVFSLYDTFGFPLDLTELILRENQLEADIEGFEAEMQQQKARARNAAAVKAGDWVILKDIGYVFVGYDCIECEVEIVRYRQVQQKGKTFYQLVLDKTPFYAEMGGQVGDSGYLEAEGERLPIIEVKKENDLSVHICTKLPADPTRVFRAVVDRERRNRISANHTATHLLHEALREVLGTHVEQKGSYVSDELLRFDFSHFQKMSEDEIRRVERLVNRKIRSCIELDEHRHTSMQEAREMGAIALFGEKYGEEVRVVRFGSSIELCGGTHASSTGRIGYFCILSESSIAAGVRRIEALTGEKAEEHIDALKDKLSQIREMFNQAPGYIDSIRKTIDENHQLRKELEALMAEKVQQIKAEIKHQAVDTNGFLVIRLTMEISPDQVKNIAFQLRGECADNVLFVAGTSFDNKPTLSIMLGKDLVDKGLNAGKLIREAAQFIQGNGGGQAHFAMAGGKDASGLQQAVQFVVDTVTA
ncbi:MAG TPA: alanine--tRNA ligase [Bacteroidales bacterium]|jgi:alanyl-tRNA synthetase|nr:alanine--tRNA ligase [Bacteroidales bacterium]HQB71438.1 alanine--tRNA ligase [Bacteroidales bacterium]